MVRSNTSFEEDAIDRLARIEQALLSNAEIDKDVKVALVDYGLRITSLEKFQWKLMGAIGLCLFVGTVVQTFEYFKGVH